MFCTTSETEGEVVHKAPPLYFIADRSNALVLLWFACFWCQCFGDVSPFKIRVFKPRSHSAGMAPVHPGGGQPVYRDEPGHFS